RDEAQWVIDRFGRVGSRSANTIHANKQHLRIADSSHRLLCLRVGNSRCRIRICRGEPIPLCQSGRAHQEYGGATCLRDATPTSKDSLCANRWPVFSARFLYRRTSLPSVCSTEFYQEL